VLSAHGSLPRLVERKTAKRFFDRLFGKRLIRHAARLIAVSPAEMEQYRRAQIAPAKTALVLNGLDLEEFEDLPPAGTFRHRHGIPPEAPLVLALGRVHRIKGLDHLIGTLARVRQDCRETMLVIAGPDDGDLGRLRDMAAGLDLQDDVGFPGSLYGRDRLAALVDADVVVAPAPYEIFGLVPFEALMCGTPVIVGEGSGSSELIRKAGAGYLVPFGDSAALEEALLQVVAHPADSHVLVRRGQAFVRQELDWNRTAARLEGIYAQMSSS
jgi:glycosyltransferase involved in cell wall biosynthesis